MPNFLRKLFGRQSHPDPVKEDSDLTKFYTDSEKELQLFEQLVTAMSLPKRILVIHGLGGFGKSTLLKMFVLSCHRHHIPVALVAGEEALSPVDVLTNWADSLSDHDIMLSAFQKTLNHYRAIQAKVEAEVKKASQATSQLASSLSKTAVKTAISIAASAVPVIGPLIGAIGGEGAEAVMDWLHGFLSKSDLEFYLDPAKRLDGDFLSDLASVAARQRLVLMIDTYEQMTALDDWMRELSRRLPKNVLMVFASRTVPEWDRAWQEWLGKAEVVELREMSPDDLRTLVRRYYSYIRSGDPDPKQVEAIVQFARGLPMAATTVVQLWVKYHADDFQTVRPRVVADLADRLLEGVPQEMRPAFEVAAVLRYFNVEALETMLENEKAEWVYAELRRWPFIRSRREGLAMHDAMREVINGALNVRTPKRFQLLHERAAKYYATRLEMATGDERDRYALELLYQQVMADEKEGIKRFRKSAEELVRYQLPSQLSTLLNDVNNYPLQNENSRLWREYYQARLKDMEGRPTEILEIYQKIAENEEAEETLRAYAACDWAWISRLTSLENMEQILERIRTLIPQLEALPEPDAKIGSYFFELADLYKRQGKWSEVLANIERARNLYTRIGDMYGLASATNRLEYYYLDRGMWKEGFLMREKGLQEVTKLTGEQQQSYLKAEFLGGYAINWVWAGRYHEMESRLQEALRIAERFERIRHHIIFSRDLALVLGLQGELQEAALHFANGEKLGTEQNPMDEVYLNGFQGLVALKWVGAQEAEHYLAACMTRLNEVGRKEWFLTSFLNWYGTLYEIKGDLESAEKCYQDCLKRRRLELWYWHTSSLVGLARIYVARSDHKAFNSVLQEAEELSQEYEYNDHLACLRLIQGHFSWEMSSSNEKLDFDTTLRFYQQAMIYALRYNRFLLDDLLSGRPQGTPFEPIIPYCLKRSKEGEQILLALRAWWQQGTNSIDSVRESISPIPEGMPLLHGEGLARQLEPGDWKAQPTILDQLKRVLPPSLTA